MENVRTLILSNFEKNKQAILNLKNNNESEVKFFNFGDYKNKNFALGIKQGERVFKIPLNVTNNICKFNLVPEIDLKNNVLCAIVDVTNAFCPEIVMSGSNNSKDENCCIEENFVVNKPDDSSVLYAQETEEDINKIVDKNLQDDMNSTYFDCCCHCKYREAFYSDCEKFSLDKSSDKEINNVEKESLDNFDKKESCEEEKNVKEDEEEKEGEDFYSQIKSQIDALFNKYESEESLSKIVANSKWVKVNYDGGENYYVLGLIYDDNFEKVEFISYGLPAVDKDNPPEDLREFAQWLPVENEDFNKIFGGYFLVYQKASDGETIKVSFM